MDNIFEINDKFDFSNITLNDPILINNNYFSKINYGKYNKNLYLRLNKCFSKNSIVKTSNKCFCELNYIINENNIILEFFEKLEKLCLDEINKKKDKWFYNSDNITNDDIGNIYTDNTIEWLKTIDTVIEIEKYNIPNTIIEAASENIPEEPFSYETWDIWTKSIINKTGLKGRSLFMPLRLILTGKDKGPELKNFLPLLDKETLLRKFGKI